MGNNWTHKEAQAYARTREKKMDILTHKHTNIRTLRTTIPAGYELQRSRCHGNALNRWPPPTLFFLELGYWKRWLTSVQMSADPAGHTGWGGFCGFHSLGNVWARERVSDGFKGWRPTEISIIINCISPLLLRIRREKRHTHCWCYFLRYRCTQPHKQSFHQVLWMRMGSYACLLSCTDNLDNVQSVLVDGAFSVFYVWYCVCPGQNLDLFMH